MKKAQIQIGETYHAKVSGKTARVRIDAVSPFGGWTAKNLDTGRQIHIKTAGRLRPILEPRRVKAWDAYKEFGVVEREEGYIDSQQQMEDPIPF